MPSLRKLSLIAAVALGCAPLLVVGGSTAASTTGVHYMSYLRFPDGAAQTPLYGPTPAFRGSVRGVSPDSVDFSGRSVIDLGRSTSLDPGTADFTFGAVVRLTRGSGDWNIMQKGYWSDRGQWKLSLDRTSTGLRFSCRVKGSSGSVMAYSPRGVVTPGGPWVRAECHRDRSGVSVLVNGRVVGRASGRTGDVRSSSPYLIGSKGMSARHPDQFLGLMDYVWVKR